MAKLYKEIAICRMCKTRFVVEDKSSQYSHSSRSYCPECCEKYFKKKKDEE